MSQENEWNSVKLQDTYWEKKKGYIDLKNHTNIKGNDKKIKMERNKMSVLIFLQHLFLYFVITFFLIFIYEKSTLQLL